MEKPAIAQLVQELRQAMKLSQEQFADKWEMNFPTINCGENKHAVPSRLASILRTVGRLTFHNGRNITGKHFQKHFYLFLKSPF